MSRVSVLCLALVLLISAAGFAEEQCIEYIPPQQSKPEQCELEIFAGPDRDSWVANTRITVTMPHSAWTAGLLYTDDYGICKTKVPYDKLVEIRIYPPDTYDGTRYRSPYVIKAKFKEEYNKIENLEGIPDAWINAWIIWHR